MASAEDISIVGNLNIEVHKYELMCNTYTQRCWSLTFSPSHFEKLPLSHLITRCASRCFTFVGENSCCNEQEPISD